MAITTIDGTGGGDLAAHVIPPAKAQEADTTAPDDVETESADAAPDADTDTTDTETDADAETPADPAKPFDPARYNDKIAKANREANALRREVKRLKEIEARVKAEDDSKKSDLDKAVARAEAAEAALKDSERNLAIATVKDRFDLPAKVLAGLEGSTVEELIESAEEWATELGIEDKSKRKPRQKPVAKDLNGGRDPNEKAPMGRTVESVVADLQLWR